MSKFRSAGRMFTLAALFVLAACTMSDNRPPGGGDGAGNALSGTVTAPAGGDVQGTLVEACFVVNGFCDDASANTKSVTIQQGGASGSYSIANLSAGQYGLFACKDNNGNNQGYSCDEGDLYGFYTTDGQNPQGVVPPDSGLDIDLFVLGSGGGGGGGGMPGASRNVDPDYVVVKGAQDRSVTAVDGAGVTHLLYTGVRADGSATGVRYGECSAGCGTADGWQFVTLGDYGSPGLGGGARMALDANGHPRVLWYSQAEVAGDGEFLYAQCDAACTTKASWSIATIITAPGGMASGLSNNGFALDQLGHPRFVFMDLSNGVTYAYCDVSDCVNGGDWQLTSLASSELGPAVDLAFDAGGALHAGYEGTILDNNGFPIDVVGYATCPSNCGTEANWLVLPLMELPSEVGAPFSLTLTEQGGPRLVFFDGTSLIYLWCDTRCDLVDNWAYAETGLPPYSGQSGVQLIIDGAGQPVLAYSGAADAASIDSANLAVCTAGCETAAPTWSSTLIETYQDIEVPAPDPCASGGSFWRLGIQPSLALDASGDVHAAYGTSYVMDCPGWRDEDGNIVDLVGEFFGPLRYAEP